MCWLVISVHLTPVGVDPSVLPQPFLPVQAEEALPRHVIPDLGLIYFLSHPHHFHLQHKL